MNWTNFWASMFFFSLIDFEELGEAIGKAVQFMINALLYIQNDPRWYVHILLYVPMLVFPVMGIALFRKLVRS